MQEAALFEEMEQVGEYRGGGEKAGKCKRQGCARKWSTSGKGVGIGVGMWVQGQGRATRREEWEGEGCLCRTHAYPPPPVFLLR